MTSVPPPPPPPPFSPPPGYVPYGAVAAPVAEPRGLRTATLVLFGIASALCLALGLVAHQRGRILADYFDGVERLEAVDSADARVAGVAAMFVLTQLAAVIVLCLWSYRTVKNASLRSPGSRLSPGLACGGWYIPLANYFVPWTQLRRAGAVSGTPGSRALTVWQVLFLLQAVITVASRSSSVENALTSESAVDVLQRQGVLLVVAGLALSLATFAATVAMREIDAVTSGTALR